MNKEINIRKLKEKGITLVALVVTMIILLILAGVTINIALSENGLFHRAQNSAERYKVAQTNEQELLTNLEEELDKYSIKPLVTTITTTEHGTIKAQDKLGNPVTVPGAFKVVAGETVEDGIVIEDANGNQFVWIPVSNIDGNNDGKGTGLITKNNGEKVEITLGRYEFNRSNGNSTLRQSGANRSSEDIIIDSFYTESTSEPRTNGGVGAKDLDEFVTSVGKNHGYYLARYEASFASGETPNGTYGTDGVGITNIMTNQKPAIKPTKQNDGTVHTNNSTTSIKVGDLWRCITQEDSTIVCKNMYSSGNESNYVKSDLVNSYAWDTAIVYIQAMGHNNYANANRETNNNTELKNTGDTGDEVCHIYDMAGNLMEWITEYSIYTNDTIKNPCVLRGGHFNWNNRYTYYRDRNFTTYNSTGIGFRPLIYV